ncbi:transcription elongation factor GreB [Niveispirillum sp. SYP-B3756]|uniref:transcription elongation factor GreB n=1 Tax=Azospirillaceae TaxID=2829815 RepID=UPI000B6DB3E7|nr:MULTISPECIES: transcription elongation factor GreB [Azospirillaceae]MDG5496518.1 transcription elongation factor GreB [Niveispirillum sp. BGYR6]MQP64557.1 transcription elongation factor GreB [Niveispirillum sp. SYP-B3756]SNS69679.1 transcription elongation factor GreB [Azospirillum sp. RU38E]SNS87771.1 transcription elongation factor GreB [Azospirillum sp. RU37A]
MSKAWVNENARDAAADDDGADDPRPLPPGTKNHITPAGFDRMQRELQQLLRVERPKVVEIVHWAAGNGDRSENGDYIYGKKRLREIDRRMRFLSKRLEIANVVDPAQQKQKDRVFFGATVTYVREDDSENTVTIVGVDETDMGPGLISWVSPIARALLKAQVGDLVAVRTPAGLEEIEVLSIHYPTAST